MLIEAGEYFIEIKTPDKTIKKRVGNKETALKVIKQLEIKQPLTIDTFNDVSFRWFENYVKKRLRPGTIERYESTLKIINPVIGTKFIDKIKRSDIKTLLNNEIEKGKSQTSVELMRTVISSVFNYAIDEELIKHNPTTNILKSLNLKKQQQKEINPYTKDEARQFLEICKNHYPESYPFFMTAFNTGLRLGELLALDWHDIDLVERKIKVYKSYKRKELTGTKTGKTRYVDISDKLYEILKAEYKKTGIVFVNNKGKRHEQNTIGKHFKRILKRFDLRKIRFHDIRHTFISILISNGAKLLYVKEQAGHSSIKMTIDVYSKWLPNDDNLEINKLDI
jgi:integrase